MTVLHIEGFDLTGTTIADLEAKGNYNAANGTISTTGGKFGGGALSVASTAIGLAWSPASFQEYVTISGWIKTPSTLAAATIYAYTDRDSDVNAASSDFNFSLEQLANGSWRLNGDSGSTRATSATGIIATDTWYHIEIRVHCAASGNMTLYVDEEQLLDAAGDYLESSATGTFFANGVSGGISHDDWVIQGDGSALPALLGLHRIHSLLPSADTAQADFTGAFGDIDDALGTTHDGDTTVISSATLNDKSEFAMTDLTGTPATVYAVQASIVTSKTDAGSKAVTPYIVSNAVREDGAEFNPADSAYLYTENMHELNPDGSVAWTSTTVNAILMGVEVTT